MSNFSVPLQSEISSFLKSKRPEFPNEFCDWYADKIWLFYDQKGWMIGKNKMQKWKSAVSLHFLDLNDQNQAELNKYKVIPLKHNRAVLTGIEEIYEKYITHPTQVENGVLAALYDEMKEKGLITVNSLSKEQWGICKKLSPPNNRAQAVKYAFENRALNRKIS